MFSDIFRGIPAANRSNKSPEHDEVRHVATEKEPGKQYQVNSSGQHNTRHIEMYRTGKQCKQQGNV